MKDRCTRVPTIIGVLTTLLFLNSLACQQDPESNDAAELVARAWQLNAESERLADAGDYRGAIVKAKAALIIFEKLPRSEELQVNQRELIQALDEASDAASFVDEVERFETEFKKHFEAGEYEKSLDCLQQLGVVLQKIPGTEELQSLQKDRIENVQSLIKSEIRPKNLIDGFLFDTKSTDATARREAVKALAISHQHGLIGTRLEAVKLVLEQLATDDPEHAIRQAAGEALQEMGLLSNMSGDGSLSVPNLPVSSNVRNATKVVATGAAFRDVLNGLESAKDPLADPIDWTVKIAVARDEKQRYLKTLVAEEQRHPYCKALCLALDAFSMIDVIMANREVLGETGTKMRVEFSFADAEMLLRTAEAYEKSPTPSMFTILEGTTDHLASKIGKDRVEVNSSAKLLGSPIFQREP